MDSKVFNSLYPMPGKRFPLQGLSGFDPGLGSLYGILEVEVCSRSQGTGFWLNSQSQNRIDLYYLYYNPW